MVQAGDGAAAHDGRIGVRVEGNAGKLRRARGQGPERRHDARANEAAEVGIPSHTVEIGRRAVIHGNHRTRLGQEAARAEGPHQTVGPHLIGPLIAVLQRYGYVPVRKAGRQFQKTLAGVGHEGIHAGHDRADDAGVDQDVPRSPGGRGTPRMAEQRGDLKPEAVPALAEIGRQGIRSDQPFRPGHADFQGGVADVDEQRVHHLSHVCGAASRFQSATASRISSARAGSSTFL